MADGFTEGCITTGHAASPASFPAMAGLSPVGSRAGGCRVPALGTGAAAALGRSSLEVGGSRAAGLSPQGKKALDYKPVRVKLR